MNEQIKNLVLQNRDIFHNGVTEVNSEIYIHGSQSNLEKFAELIVRECVLAIENESMDSGDEWESGLTIAIDGVRQRFGIE